MMLKRLLSSKKFLFFSVFIFILALAGFFCYWWNSPKSNLRKWWIEKIEIGGSVKDFSIEETETGVIVENKRENFRAQAPVGWRSERAETSFYSTWGVHFFSPDSEIKAYDSPDLYLLEKGCVIDVFIERSDLYHETVKAYIESAEDLEEPSALEEDGIEIIEIDGHQAVKNLLYDIPEQGKRIEVRIPREDDKNIYFLFCSSQRDAEKCSQVFDEFLKTVSLK